MARQYRFKKEIISDMTLVKHALPSTIEIGPNVTRRVVRYLIKWKALPGSNRLLAKSAVTDALITRTTTHPTENWSKGRRKRAANRCGRPAQFMPVEELGMEIL